ncbi:MAG: hypothetical protein WEC36_02635, partial [Phycisphaeraceae bacterium]
QGVILYFNGTDWVALSPGTAGHFLKTNGAAANPAWAAASAGGGGAAWTLAGSRNLGTSPVSDVLFWDLTGLTGATDILLVVRAVTMDISGTLFFRVSVDGGSTFLAASGDYVALSTTGVETNETRVIPYNSSATAARTGWAMIRGCDIAAPKSVTNIFGAGIIPTTSAINAVRVLAGAAGVDTTGGNAYVLWR